MYNVIILIDNTTAIWFTVSGNGYFYTKILIFTDAITIIIINIQIMISWHLLGVYLTMFF